MLRDRQIAIVGAGIGGLAAAVALARRGAAVTLCEASPVLVEAGAGLQLGPNGVAALEALGLREAAAAAVSVPDAILLRDGPTGRQVARVPMGAACLARYGRPYWQIHRADLVAVLFRGAQDAGADLRLGARVAALEESGGCVTLRLAGGDSLRADAVIAADGIRSATRAALSGERQPRFTGHVAWRALLPASRVPGLAPVASVAMGPGRHVVTYPLRGGEVWNLVAVEERAAWAEEGWSLPSDPAALRAAFHGWAEPLPALLRAVETTFLWGLFDHSPLASWTRGRVALLGDSCHPMLPFLAQGAAMALEDAWVLGVCLDADADIPAALLAWEALRKPRTTRVQRAAARNGRLWHLRAPALRLPAQAALAAASRLAPGLLLSRFDWLYGADVTGAG